MALVRTDRTAAGDTTGRATYTTASFSVAAGDLIVAFFQYNAPTSWTAAAPALGGTLTGITWTPVTGVRWNSNGDRIDAWYGACASSVSGTLTFTITAGGSGAGAVWSVFTYTGHDTGGPVSAGVSMTDTDAAFGPLSASSLTGSLTVWGVTRNTNTTGGSTFTGATLIHDVAHAAPTRHLISFEKAAENSPGVTWNPASAWTAAGVAFKIREPAGGALPHNVVVGGVKKTIVSESVVVGGAKKPVVNRWVVVAGAKKPVV